MSMLVVIVEDDYYDWEWLRDELGHAYPQIRCVWISTERMFRDRMSELESEPPIGFIFDVMLPWDVPRAGQGESELPDDVKTEGFYSAGLRCRDLVRNSSGLAAVPTVLYTGLDRNNFPEQVLHVKSDDSQVILEQVGAWVKAYEKRLDGTK